MLYILTMLYWSCVSVCTYTKGLRVLFTYLSIEKKKKRVFVLLHRWMVKKKTYIGYQKVKCTYIGGDCANKYYFGEISA